MLSKITRKLEKLKRNKYENVLLYTTVVNQKQNNRAIIVEF